MCWPGAATPPTRPSHRGGPRGHRALQRRHRRRRLPRLLRRQDQEGQHHRRPRDGARGRSPDGLHRPATGQPWRSTPPSTPGCRSGRPGTPALWARPSRGGARGPSAQRCTGERLAPDGFVVDQTFHDQTAANAARFAHVPRHGAVFLPGGQPPAVGSTFRNPDMARPTARCAPRESARSTAAARASDRRRGAAPVRRTRRQRHGRPADPAPTSRRTGRSSRRRSPRPTAAWTSTGCPSPSSGGIAVAEILNLLEAYDKQHRRPPSSLERAVPALVLRGERDGVRRPQPLGRRRPRRAGQRADVEGSPPSGPACSHRPRHDRDRSPYGSPDGSLRRVPGLRRPARRAARGPVARPTWSPPTSGATSPPTP